MQADPTRIPQDLEAVVADLESLVEAVNSRLREIERLDMAEFFADFETDEEREEFVRKIASETGEYEEGISWVLRTLCARLLLYCEALGLPATRSAVQQWRSEWPDDVLGKTETWGSSEADGRESRAFSAISPIVEGLIVLLRHKPALPPAAPVDQQQHVLLQHCLRSMAMLVRKRGITPTREADVQEVMHSHLEGVFADYTRTLTIAKPLLSFKPDGGVISLGAAIECKFVANEKELATAMHGLTEDLSGYSGSKDWTRFYTLIFMTEAFTTEKHVSRALGASGAEGKWTTIVVTGTGARVGNRARRHPPPVGPGPEESQLEPTPVGAQASDPPKPT